MIPAPFDYVRAGSADEALSLLGSHGDEAKLLAGGHSLIPLMKLRLAAPSVLIDVGRVSDLSYIREAGDQVAIGALTRHRDIETSQLLQSQVPILAHVAGLVGDPQVRHRGTIGGSLAHGDPASDLPAGRLRGETHHKPHRGWPRLMQVEVLQTRTCARRPVPLLAPEPLGRQPCPFCHGLELGPYDGGVDFRLSGGLRGEAAVTPGNDILAPHEVGIVHETLSH